MKTKLIIQFLSLGGYIAMAESPGTFTAAGNMTTPRASHTASLLANGKVLIAGGGQWTQTGSPPRTVWLLLDSAELYDPSNRMFIATGNMTAPRQGHTATPLPNGKVLIAGGASSVSSADLYDPATGAFTATGDMSADRVWHTATLLNNGKVLIAGGSSTLTGADLYDPATGAFTATGEMTTVRLAHTAVLLTNGKVFIGGGIAAGGINVVSNELYDPEAGTFRPTGETPQLGEFGNTVATATLLGNGKVLTTLQYSEGPDDGAAEYDPATEAFTVAGKMTHVRKHTATLLPDGTVLVAGLDWTNGFGYSAQGLPSVDADLYDPHTGTFSATGALATGRFDHTATLLSDGAVVITGGRFPFAQPLATAELYHPARLATAPVLFSLWEDGRGQGAILHAGTPRLASSSDPASVGEPLEIYLTGLTDGSRIPPQVVIGGRMAEVLFFGKAPGLAGVNQVNVRVPSGVALGPAVPVRLTYLGRSSNEVTLAVQ